MVNRINAHTKVKIYEKIGRQVWGKLWYLWQTMDTEGSGRVEIPVPELLTSLNISQITLYEWLKEGKEAGAFRDYKTINKDIERIYLGSKVAIYKKLGITDRHSTTEIELWQLLNNSEIGIQDEPLREQVTKFQAYWMQIRAIKATKEKEREKREKIIK